MEKYVLIFICLFAIVLIASCEPAGQMYLVYDGNNLYNQGKYQKSLSSYLNALKQKTLNEWCNYNLGNVYYVIGESDRASNTWIKIVEKNKNNNENLLFSIYYNLGIFYYETGEYKKAYESFKNSLLLKPLDINSKINLEHSYQKVVALKNSDFNNVYDFSDEDSNVNAAMILDYIKSKEVYDWGSPKGSEKSRKNFIDDW